MKKSVDATKDFSNSEAGDITQTDEGLMGRIWNALNEAGVFENGGKMKVPPNDTTENMGVPVLDRRDPEDDDFWDDNELVVVHESIEGEQHATSSFTIGYDDGSFFYIAHNRGFQEHMSLKDDELIEGRTKDYNTFISRLEFIFGHHFPSAAADGRLAEAIDQFKRPEAAQPAVVKEGEADTLDYQV